MSIDLSNYFMAKTEAPNFAERLAYVRWLRDRGRQRPESERELAGRADVGYAWLQKWKRSDTAPAERTLTARLVNALKVEARWLLDGDGDAPEPERWKEWLAAKTIIQPYHGKPVEKSTKKRGRKAG